MIADSKKSVKDRDIISGKISPDKIREKMVFLEVSVENPESDIKQALRALDLMGKDGWKLVSYHSTMEHTGFMLERAS